MRDIDHLSTSIPAHHTRSIERVALMSSIGSPDMRTKSARFPTSITPRSVNPKYLAGKQVAARNASTFDRPASTKSSSSWCSDSPCSTYKTRQAANQIFTHLTCSSQRFDSIHSISFCVLVHVGTNKLKIYV